MINLDVLSPVGLPHYLLLSSFIFVTGMTTVLLRKNILIILMGIELMLNAVNLSFLAFSHFNSQLNGQLIVFFIMIVAAAEAGVGLALAVAIFKRFNRVDLPFFETLKG